MSQLKTQPIVKCKAPRGCGNMVTIALVSTTGADSEGAQLMELTKAVMEKALCKFHQGQYNHYASRGMGQGWWQGLVP
jgi:hypothetical protein